MAAINASPPITPPTIGPVGELLGEAVVVGETGMVVKGLEVVIGDEIVD
jgi:hypothetical protein